jgi:signal peptidase I
VTEPVSPPSPSGDPKPVDPRRFEGLDDPTFDEAVAAADGPYEVDDELLADEVDEEEDENDTGHATSRTRNLIEWGVVIIGALVVALLIKTFLFQAFYIPSESMVPTLGVGDRVIVNKLSDDPNRGDLVVFAKPDGEAGGVQDLIKRVVGLPGETVSVTDNVVFIDKNDGAGPISLDEPYLPEGTITDDFQGTPIPEGYSFMMGDNRDDSRDSRFFGPIPQTDVVGRAFLRVWPPGELGFL